MVYAIAVSLVVSAFFLTFSHVSADCEVHKNPLQHIPPKRYRQSPLYQALTPEANEVIGLASGMVS